MRVRSIVAAAGAALLSVAALGAGTADAAGPLTGTKVRNWQLGFVLGVAGNSTVGGAVIQYQNDTDDKAQFWAVEPVTSDTFVLRNLNSDMCVTQIGAAGSALQQRPCDPRFEEQVFSLIESSRPNRYQLKNADTGQCLNPSTTGVNGAARLVACSTTNAYNTHSFDTR